VVYGPARLTETERMTELARYRARVLTLGEAPTLAHRRVEEYDDKVLFELAAWNRERRLASEGPDGATSRRWWLVGYARSRPNSVPTS
jgi:hypothetical protein